MAKRTKKRTKPPAPEFPFPSVGALFDRARDHIPRAKLPGLLMCDPGIWDYVAAYEVVLTRGMPALFEDSGGLPLHSSFDITESFFHSHTDSGASVTHRWFSVLTACIELFNEDTLRYPRSSTLRALLVHSFALESADVFDAPLDLLPPVFQELQANWKDRHECTLAMIAELCTGALPDERAEALCRELHARHDEAQEWYLGDGEENPYFAEHPVFIWGALPKWVLGREELRTWLDFMEKYFPSSPALAGSTRERLLREGNAWFQSSRGT